MPCLASRSTVLKPKWVSRPDSVICIPVGRDHSARGRAALQSPLIADFDWLTSPMPELPEVETVRRGLQPVMEGARFLGVEARRPDLRRPLPKNFVKRLEGLTVTGLGRRAKYLLADLSSGDVLMMHLGMS